MNQATKTYLIGLDYGSSFAEMEVQADSEPNARKVAWAALTEFQKDNLASMEVIDEQDENGPLSKVSQNILNETQAVLDDAIKTVAPITKANTFSKSIDTGKVFSGEKCANCVALEQKLAAKDEELRMAWLVQESKQDRINNLTFAPACSKKELTLCKFTKGPWIVHGNGFDLEPLVVGTPHYPIAKVNHVGDEETIANAKLMSSAPDLYEALQAMLEFPNAGPSHDMARAALSKATA